MAPFLKKLAAVLRTLPLGLLDARSVVGTGQPAAIEQTSRRIGRHKQRDLQ
jgi:hypothetical protein